MSLVACASVDVVATDANSDSLISTDAPIIPDGSTLQGTVWAPGYGPNFVATGYEIPVPGALVYLAVNPPEAIPQQAYCEQCVETPGTSAFTDPKGNFRLVGVVPGEYILVIQKGQFRLEQVVVVPDGELELGADATTLPNVHDPDNGRWLPKMAIATGVFDRMENIFGKMGIGGTVDDNGQFVPADGTGTATSQLHFYANRGQNNFTSSGTLTDLVSDVELMKQYHIIFIPCSYNDNVAALQSEQNLRNIREYVAAGGKFYAADWSGEWIDNVFPAQLTFEVGDTPASAYDDVTGTWDTSQFGVANGEDYVSYNGEARDVDVFAWLDDQRAPQPFEDPDSNIDASAFGIADIWTKITQLTAVPVGFDAEGIPIVDGPETIVIGGEESSEPKLPLTVSFQPAGCGRVIFSGFHTAENSFHLGLFPQERLLIYLIMEIGECVGTVIVE